MLIAWRFFLYSLAPKERKIASEAPAIVPLTGFAPKRSEIFACALVAINI
jgi:hypothetical protein